MRNFILLSIALTNVGFADEIERDLLGIWKTASVESDEKDAAEANEGSYFLFLPNQILYLDSDELLAGKATDDAFLQQTKTGRFQFLTCKTHEGKQYLLLRLPSIEEKHKYKLTIDPIDRLTLELRFDISLQEERGKYTFRLVRISEKKTQKFYSGCAKTVRSLLKNKNLAKQDRDLLTSIQEVVDVSRAREQ